MCDSRSCPGVVTAAVTRHGARARQLRVEDRRRRLGAHGRWWPGSASCTTPRLCNRAPQQAKIAYTIVAGGHSHRQLPPHDSSSHDAEAHVERKTATVLVGPFTVPVCLCYPTDGMGGVRHFTGCRSVTTGTSHPRCQAPCRDRAGQVRRDEHRWTLGRVVTSTLPDLPGVHLLSPFVRGVGWSASEMSSRRR